MELVKTKDIDRAVSLLEQSIKDLDGVSKKKIDELKAINIEDDESCDILVSETSHAKSLHKQIMEARLSITRHTDSFKKTAMVPEKALDSAINQAKNRALVFKSQSLDDKQGAFEDAVVVKDMEVSTLDVYRNFAHEVIGIYKDFIENLPDYLEQLLLSKELKEKNAVDVFIDNKIFHVRDQYDACFDKHIETIKAEIGVKGIGSFMRHFNEGNFSFSTSGKDIKDSFDEVIETIVGDKHALSGIVESVLNKGEAVFDVFLSKVKENSNSFISEEIIPSVIENLEEQLKIEYNIHRFDSEFNASSKGNDLQDAQEIQTDKGSISSKEAVFNVVNAYLEATDDWKGVASSLEPMVDYLVKNKIEVEGMIVEKKSKVKL